MRGGGRTGAESPAVSLGQERFGIFVLGVVYHFLDGIQQTVGFKSRDYCTRIMAFRPCPFPCTQVSIVYALLRFT